MATQAFLDMWRSGTGRLAHLVKIRLRRDDGGPDDSLYLSMDGVATQDDSGGGEPARFWAPAVLDINSVHAPGGFCSTDIPLCTTSLTLRADAVVAIGGTPTALRQMLKDHLWVNGRVTIWRHFPELGDFANAQQVFSGAAYNYSINDNEIELLLRQRAEWNRPVALSYIERKTYPRAMENSVGLPLPIAYGRLEARPPRWFGFSFFAHSPFGFGLAGFYNTFGPSSPMPCRSVLVDRGRSGQAALNVKSKVLVAAHQVRSLMSTSALSWFESDGAVASLMYPSPFLEPTTTPESFNDPSGAGFLLPETGGWAVVRILPTGFTTEANQPDNLRTLFEPNDVSHCLFDYSANKRNVTLTFPDTPDLGVPEQITAVVAYQPGQGLSGLEFTDTIGGAIATPLNNPAAPGAVSSPLIRDTIRYVMSGWNTSAIQIRIAFSGGAPAGKCKVFLACLMIRFRPRQNQLVSARTVEARTVQSNTLLKSPAPYREWETLPPITELVGNFYSHLFGVQDNGSGTYTGTPNEAIERMPDIARHVLTIYGAQTDSNLDLGTFLAARTLLVDQLGRSLPHGLSITEDVDVRAVLSQLLGDSLSQLAISPYTDKFRLHVWRDKQPTDYSWVFSRYDLVEGVGPQVDSVNMSELINAIKVAYDYDKLTKTWKSEVVLESDRSVAGYAYRNLRDGSAEIVAGKNDRLNWTRGSARVATLAALDYDPGALAKEVQEKMRAADPGSFYWCAHGGTVVAGANDLIDYNIGAFLYTATLNPGTYTMEALATEVARAMNAGSPGFSCTYSRTTRRFRISRAVSFTVNWRYPFVAYGHRHATALLGFTDNKSATVHESDAGVEEGRFIIVCADVFDLNFQSGPDGADSAVSVRHCAEPLGFDPSEDELNEFSYRAGDAANTPRAHLGDVPIGTYERPLKQTAGRYGTKKALSIQAKTIYDTGTALSLRNRIASLLGRPRSVIRFTTRKAPDLERGQVIEFRPDMDTLVPYTGLGSDGSWAGKRFVVTETVQHMGPASLDTEVTAVDINISDVITAVATVGVMMGGILMKLQAA